MVSLMESTLPIKRQICHYAAEGSHINSRPYPEHETGRGQKLQCHFYKPAEIANLAKEEGDMGFWLEQANCMPSY